MFNIEGEPTSPGEILDEEFLKPLNMTQKQLADHLGCDVKVINRIVNGRASITAEMAVRLASALGTSPEFWLKAIKNRMMEAAGRRREARPRPLPFPALE